MNTLKCRKPETGLHVGLLALVFGTVLAFLIIPQITFSADVVGVGVVEMGEEPQVMGDAIPGEMGDLAAPDEYDLKLVVPVQIENLYLNVDRGRIICQLDARLGQDDDWETVDSGNEEFDIEGGAYSNTYTFYLSITPDMNYHDIYRYKCSIGLKDSESGDEFRPVWRTTTNADILVHAPAWTVMSGSEGEPYISGLIDW